MCQVEFIRVTDLYLHTDIDPLSLYLSPTHIHSHTVYLYSHTIGDSVERCYGSVDSFEQVFGFVSRSFNSALEPGHPICILYKHTQTHTQVNDDGLIWSQGSLLIK